MKSPRFWTVTVLLAVTALILQTRGAIDRIPVSAPLSEVPRTIAGWNGSDLEINKESLDVLGAGDFLSRTYTKDARSLPIGLFIGYFPSQRTGATAHSPRNCLPGAGWAFESSQYINLKDANGKAHSFGEYVVAEGENRQVVIYWYEAHGRSVASEYIAKFYLVTDAIRLNRTDGALVRVNTPIDPREDFSGAKLRAEQFVTQLAPLLPRFIPE